MPNRKKKSVHAPATGSKRLRVRLHETRSELIGLKSQTTLK